MCAPRVIWHASIRYSNSCHTRVNMGASIFLYIHSHRLATEMWTTIKNNFLGKKISSCSFYLYRFRKYVSYGFTIINFCNPGVHYETPCIIHTRRIYSLKYHIFQTNSELVYHAAYSRNSVLMFRDKFSVPSSNDFIRVWK
jgi:hypothetical protein